MQTQTDTKKATPQRSAEHRRGQVNPALGGLSWAPGRVLSKGATPTKARRLTRQQGLQQAAVVRLRSFMSGLRTKRRFYGSLKATFMSQSHVGVFMTKDTPQGAGVLNTHQVGLDHRRPGMEPRYHQCAMVRHSLGRPVPPRKPDAACSNCSNSVHPGPSPLR